MKEKKTKRMTKFDFSGVVQERIKQGCPEPKITRPVISSPFEILKIERVKSDFPEIRKERRKEFASELVVILCGRMENFINPDPDAIKFPAASTINDDVQKLFNCLLKLDDLSCRFICAEAKVDEDSMAKIKSACKHLIAKPVEQSVLMTRLNLIFSLDVLFRAFTGKCPVSAQSDFKKFVWRCFLLRNRTYSEHTAGSAVNDYLKTDLPKQASEVISLRTLSSQKPITIPVKN